jgi:hypothetical protein
MDRKLAGTIVLPTWATEDVEAIVLTGCDEIRIAAEA